MLTVKKKSNLFSQERIQIKINHSNLIQYQYYYVMYDL